MSAVGRKLPMAKVGNRLCFDMNQVGRIWSVLADVGQGNPTYYFVIREVDCAPNCAKVRIYEVMRV